MEWGAFTSISCISPPPLLTHTHTPRFHSFEIKNKIGDVCLRLSFGQPSLTTNIIQIFYTQIQTYEYSSTWMDGVMIFLLHSPLCTRPDDLLNKQFEGLLVYYGQVIFIPSKPPEFFHPSQYLKNGELFV